MDLSLYLIFASDVELHISVNLSIDNKQEQGDGLMRGQCVCTRDMTVLGTRLCRGTSDCRSTSAEAPWSRSHVNLHLATLGPTRTFSSRLSVGGGNGGGGWGGECLGPSLGSSIPATLTPRVATELYNTAALFSVSLRNN